MTRLLYSNTPEEHTTIKVFLRDVVFVLKYATELYKL